MLLLSNALFIQSPADIQRAAQTILPADIRRRIGIIADDSMRGRDTPSAELDKVAAYIGREYRRLGLTPGGDNGTFLQRYSLDRVQVVAESSVAFVHGGGATLKYGKDFVFSDNNFESGDYAGGVVLVTGPLTAPTGRGSSVAEVGRSPATPTIPSVARSCSCGCRRSSRSWRHSGSIWPARSRQRRSRRGRWETSSYTRTRAWPRARRSPRPTWLPFSRAAIRHSRTSTWSSARTWITSESRDHGAAAAARPRVQTRFATAPTTTVQARPPSWRSPRHSRGCGRAPGVRSSF